MNTKKFMTIVGVGLLSLTASYALLVNYLSNETTVNVDVESPLILEVSNDNGKTFSETNHISFSPTYAGDNIGITFIESKASEEALNREIKGNILITITSTDGVVPEEVSSFTYTEYEANNDCANDDTPSKYVDVEIKDFLPVDSNTIVMSAPTVLIEGQSCVKFDANLKFVDNAVGNYDITVQVLPDYNSGYSIVQPLED